MLINRMPLLIIGIILVSLTVGGCATSRIVETHTAFATGTEDYAEIVFFRPMPQRTRGIADNDVTVDIDKEPMVELSAGEYVVVKIKPGQARVTLRNMTYITYKVMPEEVKRARKFTFEANKRYYIQTVLKVEEYRGLYFVPREVEETKAKEILSRLKPVNQPVS